MTLLQLLNLETGASAETLNRIIATAHRRYKVYDIPKRGGGSRTIAHPARELKLIQRIILQKILNEIPVSTIATAYVRGRGIAYNARVHLTQRWILKLDFQNFFHSIVPGDWDRVARRSSKLAIFSLDRQLFHNILFWDRGTRQPTCLSIGAPTSPSVSNLVCSRLDDWMIERAGQIGVRVTRYADDITVSGASVTQLLRFEASLTRRLERNQGVRLSLNEEKRGIYGPGERRMVTGLILTPTGELSIGRERKRTISALVHGFVLGNLDPESTMRAKGLLAFAMSIEPSFVQSIRRKYGNYVIDSLLRVELSGELIASDQDDL